MCSGFDQTGLEVITVGIEMKMSSRTLLKGSPRLCDNEGEGPCFS
jgi:hypothetical protein